MLRQTAIIGDRHIGTSFSDRRSARRRRIERSSVQTTNTRTETAQPTPRMLSYVTSVGLVGVAVIICFGLATLQLFNATKNASVSSGLYVLGGVISDTPAPELSGEQAPSRPLLINGGVGSINNAARDRAVQTISTLAEQREQLFREFEREQLFRAFEKYRRGVAGSRSAYGNQARRQSLGNR